MPSSVHRSFSTLRRRARGPGLALALLLSAPGASAQSLWDDPAFRLAREAQEALQRQDYAATARLARQAIAEYPEHALAHYLLAQAALAQQRWDEAITALTTVTRLYPKSFAAHRELGVALAQVNRTPEASRAFESALALRPDGEDAQDIRVRLAFMRLQGGDKDGALPLLLMLAKAETTVPEVWTALGRLQYEREQLAESERAFRRAAELRDDGKTWFNLAVVRLRIYDRGGAIQALERAAAHPDVRAQASAELQRLGVPGSGATPGAKPPGSP
jgi:Flp pilus assembly protein TadD